MIEMMTGSDKDSVDHDKDKVYSNMIYVGNDEYHDFRCEK